MTNKLIEAINYIQKYASKAAWLNDQDHIEGNSVKAHKMLCALGGNNGYDIELDKAFKEMQAQQVADDRVWQLMDLICAEWESDPMSVQCFDLRIVEEAKALVKSRKIMDDPFNPFKKY